MTRPIFTLSVVHARHTDTIGIASPGDFVGRHADDIPLPSGGAFPYCFDLLRRRAIYVCDVDIAALRAAPFYYLHLRRRARVLLSVPIEHGVLAGSGAADPIFVFSPGRCGSTLLSRIIYEAGIPGASEVDFYTQMTAAFWCHPRNPLREPFRRAMWNLTADLQSALGGAPVIKLRSESCRAPGLLLKSHRARTLVMFRGFESWARSNARTFGSGPGKSVGKYLRALRCYAYLRKNSACHLVRFEDLQKDSQPACEKLGAFLGASIPAAAVARAKAHDSQEGTPLELGRRRRNRAWEVKFDAAMRLWHSRRLALLRDSLDIPNVWD